MLANMWAFVCVAGTSLCMLGNAQTVNWFPAGRSSPGPQAYWYPRWRDGFGGSVLNSGRWRRSFPDWNGLPPAAIKEDNVEHIQSAGLARIKCRTDRNYEFPEAEAPCTCDYVNYTTGLMQTAETFSSEAGFVEIRAKLPSSPIQASFWMQGDSSELSAFELVPKYGNGSFQSEFASSFHYFNSQETLGSARDTSTTGTLGYDVLSSQFAIYGFEWKNNSMKTYINANERTSLDLSSVVPDGVSDSWRLNVDLSLIPSFGYIENSEFPMMLRIDYIGIWEPRRLENYIHRSDQAPCRSTNDQKASERRLAGKGYTTDECAALCETLFDCAYFTISPTGKCFYFTTCEERDSGSDAQLFERITVPEPNQFAALDEFTEESSRADTMCRADRGATASETGTLGGGGHTLEACAANCSAQESCNLFVFTSIGYCKMFESCSTGQVRASSGSIFYTKNQYRIISESERCDKSRLSFRSLGGGGHTLTKCRNGCERDVTCAFFNYYKSSGFCHMFKTCELRQRASQRSDLYERVGGSQVPHFDGYTYRSVECDKDSGSNARSSPFSLGGGGHTVEACHARCTSVATCNFFQLSFSGFCHMYTTCSVTRTPRAGAVQYQKNAAASLELDGPVSGSGDQTITAVVVTLSVVAVLIALAAFGWHRRTRQGTFNEATPLLSQN